MRILSILTIFLIGIITPVWADTTIIYRKSDKKIVGWVSPPHDSQVEITNITKSALGGVISDYGTVTTLNSWMPEHVIINPDGTAILVLPKDFQPIKPNGEIYKVYSAAEVDQAAEKEVAKLSGPRAQQQMKRLRQAIKLLDVLSVECPPVDTTPGCDTKRTKALDTRTQMLDLNSKIETIYSDATAFKTAQGW